MLAIEVELLTGRYAATSHSDRRKAEWPPHPARFFSALVAALHEKDPTEPSERRALEWLECQDPPSLDVDLDVDTDFGRRTVHQVYVPVNDISMIPEGEWKRLHEQVGAVRDARVELGTLEAQSGSELPIQEIRKARLAVARKENELRELIARAGAAKGEGPPQRALDLLPSTRKRQMRTFPVVVPGRSTFVFVWPADVPDDLRLPFQRLCDRVTRLGHSSSLVRCKVTATDVGPNLRPDPEGDIVLRVVSAGQLGRLEREYQRHHQVESRVLPFRAVRYVKVSTAPQEHVRESVFLDEWIIFERVGGARPLASKGTDFTQALRRALIEANGPDRLPGALTGHREDGTPETNPHVAFVTLPFVGHLHADGSIQGFAIVLPRGLSEADRTTLFRLVARWERQRSVGGTAARPHLELTGGTLPPVRIARVDLADKWSLRPRTWCGPSRRYITATPIALDRHPGKLRSNVGNAAHRASIEAQDTIADGCEHIGLPRPVSVEVSLVPLLPGAQHVREFLPWPARQGRVARARVHVDIRFQDRVLGPVLIGAGRYFGLGLCLPVGENEGA